MCMFIPVYVCICACVRVCVCACVRVCVCDVSAVAPPVAVVLEAVVAGHGDEAARTRAQRVEDLRRRVTPHLTSIQIISKEIIH